jgi:ABC-2 type transport system permease protein
MTSFGVLLTKELTEQLRTMRLIVVLAVFGAFGILSPVLAKALPDIIKAAGGDIQITVPTPTVRDAMDQFAKNVGQMGALIAILISMGAVATEKERGTAGFLLTKPVGREEFLLGKIAAIAILLGLGLALAGLLAAAYTAVLFEPLSVAGTVASIALLWLSLAVYAAITFLASVITRSALVAGGVGFGAFIGAGIISALPTIGPYMPSSLSTSAVALALGRPGGDLAGPILVNLALVGLALVAAGIAFRREEL